MAAVTATGMTPMPKMFASRLLLVFCLGASPAWADPAADIPPMARRAKGFDVGLLAPVEGVTMRQIGQASYYFGFVPTLTKAQVLAEVGTDPAHYDAAQKVFTQRMIDDKTFTLASLFGAYAEEVAQGRFAAYGHDVARSVLAGNAPLREPMPMSQDKFEEIQAFYARKAGTSGVKPADLDLILVPYGLTFNDYQILSGWFERRLTLQMDKGDGGEPPGASDAVADAKPPERPRPDLAGLWHITWTLLKRGDMGMETVRRSRDVCIKADMTAANLPLMPKRGDAKCALQPISFFPSGFQVGAQCDQGDFGSHWSLFLQPRDMDPTIKHTSKGQSDAPPGDKSTPYTGDMEFSMETEGAAQHVAPNATTPVTARRIGDCK